MKLLLPERRAAMLENGRRSAEGLEIDPFPVVKLFTPDAGCAWLLTKLDPSDEDIAFGLCDVGLGFPEFGPVRMSEIEAVRGRLGLPVERDLFFKADKPLSKYAAIARSAGCIVT